MAGKLSRSATNSKGILLRIPWFILVWIPSSIIKKATKRNLLRLTSILSLVLTSFQDDEVSTPGQKGLFLPLFLNSCPTQQRRTIAGKKLNSTYIDIGVEDYFIHQPKGDKPPEFRGWHLAPSGETEGIIPDAQGELFSRALNLWLRWEELPNKVRLLRPYLPDGTPITTSQEEAHCREQVESLVEEESQHRQQLESELEKLRVELAVLRGGVPQ